MIRQIKETCLYVQDLERTKDFYHGKLGFDIIGHVKNRHIFFRAGTSVLLCFIPEATKAESSLPSHYATGHIHLAFEVNAGDYAGWKEKISKWNIEIIQEQAWQKGLHSFYFRDPDGHLLEIVPVGIWDKA
ncbi:MAG: VOC family protein [Cytophagaceae bacterium]|nr:VOC family protein [Cytophagaceae bacterium]